jgi:hypothetical protein
MARLGAVPQNIPGGDIYPALEKGTIDAAEWVGPHDDEKLGFHKIAPHYYYPGWWESNSMYSFYVGTKAWEALPKDYQAAFEAAAAEANIDMMAEYDFKNPPALRRLVGAGVKLHAYPVDLMRAAQDAAFDLYLEESDKNPAFKKLYDSWSKFRAEVMLWHRFAEHTYASFVYNNPPKSDSLCDNDGTKLIQREELKREMELKGLYGEKNEISFGSQIRSYVQHPYQMVKDHRTDVETGNIQAVLDGEIDEFIEGFLRQRGQAKTG